jgi:hypothetical protein
MGTNSSKKSQPIDEEKIKEEALKKFNARISSYNYPQHGSHYEYIQWCRTQYQLDYIPKFYRKRYNFKLNNN